jgi:hypothetical protein
MHCQLQKAAALDSRALFAVYALRPVSWSSFVLVNDCSFGLSPSICCLVHPVTACRVSVWCTEVTLCDDG